MLTNFNLERIQ